MFLKLLFYIAEMVWVCLSTYWIFGHHFDCGSTVQWTVRTTLMWSWLLRVLKIAGSILTLCPWKSYKPTSDGPSDLAQGNDRLTALGEQTVSRWERRFVASSSIESSCRVSQSTGFATRYHLLWVVWQLLLHILEAYRIMWTTFKISRYIGKYKPVTPHSHWSGVPWRTLQQNEGNL